MVLLGGQQMHLQAESLLIGPGDQLHILVFETPDLEQHPRVTDAGDVPLMLLGNVQRGWAYSRGGRCQNSSKS